MTGAKISALLALHSEGRLLVGRDRIGLLEKVAELGSIAKASQATGFSYKTAWDSVNAVNNLLPTPAFLTRPGGRSGGGAEVTPEGRRLIATFRRLEAKLSRISNLIAEEGLEGQEEALLWALGVRISTRNVFQTEVSQVKRWMVDVEISLKFGDDQTMLAIVTNSAADELDLAPGQKSWRWSRRRFFGSTRRMSLQSTPEIASSARWWSGWTPNPTAKFGWTSAMARRYTPLRRVKRWRASASGWAQGPWPPSIRVR